MDQPYPSESYSAGSYPAESYPTTTAPTEVSTTETTAPAEPEAGTSNSTTFNIFKVIIIVILIILIGVTLALALIWKGNISSATSNESNQCAVLLCPVGDPSYPGVVADQTCLNSAFRTNSSGNKICSTTRYAPVSDQS